MDSLIFLSEFAPLRGSAFFFTLILLLILAAIVTAFILWLIFRGDYGFSGTGGSEEEAHSGSGDDAVDDGDATGPISASALAAQEEGADSDGQEFQAASKEEARSLFAEELESGKVRQDDIYGIVYEQAPAEVDDLKEISGIAKVLEGKLNGIGVYRFKQVAVWTEEACQEFSKLLTFKNRIYDDNWIAQAKKFHSEKYGEKL